MHFNVVFLHYMHNAGKISSATLWQRKDVYEHIDTAYPSYLKNWENTTMHYAVYIK